MQVCMLPPAWGFQHHGLERYITSFPIIFLGDRQVRTLREETEHKTLAMHKASEDAWAHIYSAAKLGADLMVSHRLALPARSHFHHQLGNSVCRHIVQLLSWKRGGSRQSQSPLHVFLVQASVPGTDLHPNTCSEKC